MNAAHDAILRATIMRHKSLALTRLCIIFPKEEIAFLRVASVEVFALVRPLFLHKKEESRFAAVACISETDLILAKERPCRRDG